MARVPVPRFPERAAFAKTRNAALAQLLAVQREVVRFAESVGSRQQRLPKVSAAKLNARPGAGRWSALECLEHLNRYADHYLPRLGAKAVLAKAAPDEAYKPGLLGKPFALALHPARREKKMRSPGNMNPIGSALNAEAVVGAFRQNMQGYLEVLKDLEGKGLRGNRVPVSAFPVVRLHLGDMLHTLVWHNARHVVQGREAVG